jgi:hypothetical protein
MNSTQISMRFSPCVHVLQFVKWPRVVACILATAALVQSSDASQVQFRFEAAIDSIVPMEDAQFTLPAEFTIGNVFTGNLTFEPPFAFGQDSDSAILDISIGSLAIYADQLSFDTENDQGGTTGSTTFLSDSIAVQCMSECGTIAPSIEVLDFGILFVGDSTAISPLFDSVRDPVAWNRLEIRRLSLNLISSEEAGQYVIHASIGDVIPIPEPCTLLQAAIFCILPCLVAARTRMGTFDSIA